MEIYEIGLRSVLAIVIGGGIGYERQYKNRPAGFRTHILVCLGAAIISMIQVHVINDVRLFALNNPELIGIVTADSGRMVSQVISGIGFLGAGTIIHERGSIKGLTTAATLWVVGCVGIAIGYGYYSISIMAGVLVILILVLLKKLEQRMSGEGNTLKIVVEYLEDSEVSDFFRAYFRNSGIKIKSIEYKINEKDGKNEKDDKEHDDSVTISTYTVIVPRNIKSGDVLYHLLRHEAVIKAEIDD